MNRQCMCFQSGCGKCIAVDMFGFAHECLGCDALQGQRALDFVLRNQGLIDKTLLFDIELVKVS